MYVIIGISRMSTKDIVKKSLFLTSLFADIKSEHTWTTNIL